MSRARTRERPYVSRGGLKLDAALTCFGVQVGGAVCADFGCHVGGFVDCLLARGAARVFAVDTGYGILAARLRRDARVTVCERTNAIGFTPAEPCALVTIDAGWTPQRLLLPAAARALATGGRVITLIKPHYEAPKTWLRGGVLEPERLPAVLDQFRRDAADGGWRIEAETASPILGQGGNVEHLALLTRGGAV